MALTHAQLAASVGEFEATPARVLAQNAATRCAVQDVLARRSVTVTYVWMSPHSQTTDLDATVTSCTDS